MGDAAAETHPLSYGSCDLFDLSSEPLSLSSREERARANTKRKGFEAQRLYMNALCSQAPPPSPRRSTVHYFRQKRKLKKISARFPRIKKELLHVNDRSLKPQQERLALGLRRSLTDGGVPRAEPTFDNKETATRVRNEKKWGRSRAMVKGNIKKKKNEVHKHAMHTRTEEGPLRKRTRSTLGVFLLFEERAGTKREAGHQPGWNGRKVGLTSASRRPRAGGAWRRRSRRKGLARKT